MKHGRSRWIFKYILFYKSEIFMVFWWFNGDNIGRIQAWDINQYVRIGSVFSEKVCPGLLASSTTLCVLY